MKKNLMIMILMVLISAEINAGGGSNSCFGQWNYDKFGTASKQVTSAEASQISNSEDPCRQYVHVATKFHVRMKNWTQLVKIGTSGYVEMRATLGTASKSCGIPYNIARMDIYYDQKKHVKSLNKSYLKATMNGIGVLNECYQAIGYAFTNSGIVLPNNFEGYIKVTDSSDVITGIPSNGLDTVIRTYPNSETVNVENIPVNQISYATPPPTYVDDTKLTAGDVITGVTTVDVSGIPYSNYEIPSGWFMPGSVGVNHAVSIKPYAGAIMNHEAGCVNVKFGSYSLKF